MNPFLFLISVCQVCLAVLLFLILIQPKALVPTVLCERVDGAHSCALLTPAGETLVLE